MVGGAGLSHVHTPSATCWASLIVIKSCSPQTLAVVSYLSLFVDVLHISRIRERSHCNGNPGKRNF